MRIYAEVTESPRTCPCCGWLGIRSKGRYQRRVRHLPRETRHTTLIVACRRFECGNCARSFVQPLPGIMPWRRSSEPLRESIYQRHDDGICASTLARREVIGQATVGRIYAQFTERRAKERLSVECPIVLGIDEHSLHRHQRFATTFCDLRNRRVFDIVPGRSEAELAGYLQSLKGRERVRVVCIDLSSPYRAMIRRHFPNAAIVADRFHAVRLVMQHLLKLGRQLVPELAWRRGWLLLLRKRNDRLDPAQRVRLGELLHKQPALLPIYELKEKLCRLLCLKTQSKTSCRRHITQLLGMIHTLRSSGLAIACTLGQTLFQWRSEIVRMWRFTKNNGITEGFHRKMKLIQRRAYGFRNFNNYRLRVIAQCG